MEPAEMKQTKAARHFAMAAFALTALALSLKCSLRGTAREGVFTLRQPSRLLMLSGPPEPFPPAASASASGRPPPPDGSAAVPVHRSPTSPPAAAEAPPPPQNVAVLIHGETFRSGGQSSRSVGAPKSVGPQFEAVESQVQYLFAPLRRAGYVVRLYMAHGSSGNPSLDSQLLAKYRGAEAVAGAEVVSAAGIPDNADRSAAEKEKWSRTQGAAASLYMERAQRRREEADYFIFIRPDVILKRDVFPLWYEHRSKAAWTFPEWCRLPLERDCKNVPPGQRCVQVPDMIMSFPRPMFYVLWRNGLIPGTPGLKGRAPHYPGHHLLKELLDLDVPWENLTFWLQPGYSADPAKQANPIYRLAGRQERFGKIPCQLNSG